MNTDHPLWPKFEYEHLPKAFHPLGHDFAHFASCMIFLPDGREKDEVLKDLLDLRTLAFKAYASNKEIEVPAELNKQKTMGSYFIKNYVPDSLVRKFTKAEAIAYVDKHPEAFKLNGYYERIKAMDLEVAVNLLNIMELSEGFFLIKPYLIDRIRDLGVELPLTYG